MNKWIVTDNVNELIKSRLEELGFVVDWRVGISQEDLLEIINDYFGIIIRSRTKLDKEILDKAKRLRIIGRLGSGMENVFVPYCDKLGIECINSPEGNCNAVGEHALAMLLTLSNNLTVALNELKDGIWRREENRGFELHGKTIGIIGYGHTGTSFAKKLTGFDCQILAYDKYKSGFGNDSVKESTYQEILEHADVISFHVPYTFETHMWINKEFIDNCQKKIVLINTSRGPIASTDDLIDAIKEDKLRGLCIDVFEDEPIIANVFHPVEKYQELFKYDNVIASPHIAGWSKRSKTILATLLMEKIETSLLKQSQHKPNNK